MSSVILGIDTGGTFTDFVLWRDGCLRTHKVLSTPAAPEQAILEGIRALGLHELDATIPIYVVHGSTVATNAVLEGKGVSVVYITNRGFADLLTIGRQTRRELYNLQPRPHLPPVPSSHCLETGGRISATAELLDPLTDQDLSQLHAAVLALNPRAVAINLLFSYVDPQYEQAIATAMPEGMFISRSSVVLPEHKEYERGISTWLNAYVGPLVEGYLVRLCHGVGHARVSVMQSSGETIQAEQAGQQAVRMLLSGPAGGLAAAWYIGQQTDCRRLLTFDMGGTSSDVALIDGGLQLTNEGHIGDYPVAVPMVDMHTIGAGGGSIARVDAGGLLQVGPDSAGAEPGPACYGRGGHLATVTDANLVLGRLLPDSFLGGEMKLDKVAANTVIDDLARKLGLSREEAAEGIVRIANEHMVQALRVMSIQRGIDPRSLTLMSFGGAGGLHVCALAESLGMKSALVPERAGVLSAFGMLVAPQGRQLSRTRIGLLSQVSETELNSLFHDLAESGVTSLLEEGVRADQIQVARSIDLRYAGQSYTLAIAWEGPLQAAAAFHALHELRYGHTLELPVEIVNIRVALSVPVRILPDARPGFRPITTLVHTSLYGIESLVQVMARESLALDEWLVGPLLITEGVATTFIAEDWRVMRDEYGHLRLQRGGPNQPPV